MKNKLKVTFHILVWVLLILVMSSCRRQASELKIGENGFKNSGSLMIITVSDTNGFVYDIRMNGGNITRIK